MVEPKDPIILKSQRTEFSISKSKYNNKITPPAMNEIINLINTGQNNGFILERIKEVYSVSLTSARISQIRKRLTIEQLSYYNKNLERKLKKKANISEDMLDIIEKCYKLVKKCIADMKRIENVKELMVINNVVITIHRMYSDIVGDMDKRSTIDYNIKKALE